MRDVLERIWFGTDLVSRSARAALVPTEMVYRAAVGIREALYNSGVLRTYDPLLPALSIGNVTVGGTGKTPVAAWIASQLAERGSRPAIVLRGYGDDEPLVHRRLNPNVPVIVSVDRVAGIAEARQAGATIAVLDDAFQHRRLSRHADLVLVSADEWTGSAHLLPAGPWREPLTAIRRATLVLVTRKAATTSQVDAVNHALSRIAPRVPRSTVYLEPTALVRVSGEDRREERPLSDLRGRKVAMITAIGDPRSFIAQIEQFGAQVRAALFPDHHHFQADEIARFVAEIPAGELTVCTLKDAVKLAPRWPREAPTLWYVSQRVSVERGVGGVEHILDELTRTRDRRVL